MNTIQLDTDITVIGICGSLRKKSHTRMALKIALKGSAELGVKTELIDLRNYDLVFCDGGDSEYPEDVFRLREKVKNSQGIILGTPEYHGSFSGVLKNALDLMGFQEFQAKIIGLIGVGGGSIGAINALNGLRTVGRQLRAWVIPEQTSIANVEDKFNDQEQILDEKLGERLKHVGRQVARFSYLHSSKKIQEFLSTWEEGPQNPGGD